MKDLFEKYPNLYRKMQEKSGETFPRPSHPNGWGKIVDDLSSKIEDLILALPKKERERYFVIQTKEKFGGLRFYMSEQTKDMINLIMEAEDLSFKTCEKCGAPGVGRAGGWINTFCDEHSNGREPLKPK